MDTEKKEIVEKKVYEDGKKEYASKSMAGTALGFGIAGTALGLWGASRRSGLGIGGGMPENVNINTVSDAIAGRSGAAPTAFQAWEKECEDAIALTNTIWGLKVNTMEQMYAHRDTDVAEKFGLWKSQDKIIQMGLEGVLKESMCYTDRKTCRAIYGVVGLPSTPTTTVLEGANPFGCNCARQQGTAPTA